MKKTKNKRDAQASLDFIIDNMVTNKDFEEKIKDLGSKIDGVSNKLGNFEKHEVDKRLQLDVRVTHVEKHLHIKPPVGTIS